MEYRFCVSQPVQPVQPACGQHRQGSCLLPANKISDCYKTLTNALSFQGRK